MISELAQQAGFTLGGFAAVPDAASGDSREERERFHAWVDAGCAGEMEYLKRTNEHGELLRSSVRTAFPWARSVIVCAADYDSPHPRSIETHPPDAAWIARYAWSGDSETQRPSDYHKVLLKRLRAMETALHERCGSFQSRCYVDTGPIVERVYARYAGLGWTAKNTCLINQQLGSWLFLGVMITSLDPGEAAVLPAADRCGSCTRCIDACPTHALTPYKMDASRCISYLTIEKRGAIPHGATADDLRDGMGRNIFGCDICQDVCPWNRKAGNYKANSDPPITGLELTPREPLINPALDWLAAMNEDDFAKWFYGSPVKRARFSGFRRNLAIAMGNSGLQRFTPLLRDWSNETDEGLSEAAAWALRKLCEDSSSRQSTETRTASQQQEAAKGWLDFPE